MIKKDMDETNQGFMKYLGGLSLNKIDNANYDFSVEVKEMHLNTGKIAHGGFLSTVADTGMGTAAHQVAGDRRCVTINLDLKFIAPTKSGQEIIGFTKIQKKTKSMVFLICNLYCDNKIIAFASGVWKILNIKPSNLGPGG